MENKKGGIGRLILTLIVLTLLVYGVFILTSKYLSEYNEYKEFCKERPTFCYCSWGKCEFMLSWSSVNGLSEDTKELCNLARELNDSKMIFKTGCGV